MKKHAFFCFYGQYFYGDFIFYKHATCTNTKIKINTTHEFNLIRFCLILFNNYYYLYNEIKNFHIKLARQN